MKKNGQSFGNYMEGFLGKNKSVLVRSKKSTGDLVPI